MNFDIRKMTKVYFEVMNNLGQLLLFTSTLSKKPVKRLFLKAGRHLH